MWPMKHKMDSYFEREAHPVKFVSTASRSNFNDNDNIS